MLSLRKWKSNDPTLIEKTNNEHRTSQAESKDKQEASNETVTFANKALGKEGGTNSTTTVWA